MRLQPLALAVVGLAILTVAPRAAQIALSRGAPETFTANANVTGGGGASAATIEIHVERYTPPADRQAVETALKTGGYPAFLTALRKSPEAGYLAMKDKKVAIRWARERATAKGRLVVLVTDQPVYFVGGGQTDAKPRAGYEVAVIQFEVDDVGLGSGTMAAAARVKPGGETGVQIDDYAETPIKLVTVTRKMS